MWGGVAPADREEQQVHSSRGGLSPCRPSEEASPLVRCMACIWSLIDHGGAERNPPLQRRIKPAACSGFHTPPLLASLEAVCVGCTLCCNNSFICI